MAEVRLTPEDLTFNGLDASYTSINSTDEYLINNDGKVILHVKNNDTSSETITLVTARTVSGLTVQDPTVTISASGDKFIGVLAPGIFNDGQDLKIQFSNGTATDIAVIRI